MRNIVNRMSRYLEKRYNEDVEYVSKDGVSFGDLNAEAAGIIQNDIEPYQAFVIQTALLWIKTTCSGSFNMLQIPTMSKHRGAGGIFHYAGRDFHIRSKRDQGRLYSGA